MQVANKNLGGKWLPIYSTINAVGAANVILGTQEAEPQELFVQETLNGSLLCWSYKEPAWTNLTTGPGNDYMEPMKVFIFHSGIQSMSSHYVYLIPLHP